MARPKKTISRPYRITVRFTDMEYGLITDAAEETGVIHPQNGVGRKNSDSL